jgi:4-hydroxybenzoate polyprenyltransferase
MVVDKTISRRWAILFHLFFSVAGILMGFYIGLQNGNWIIGFANTICVFLLWFYSTSFKKKLLSGNISISLLTAWVVFVVYLLTIQQKIDLSHVINPGSQQKLLRLALLYSSFAFIITLIREVVKDIEDMEGDAKYGCKTMPIVWGVDFSKVFTTIWMVILIALLIVVMFYVLQFKMWLAAGYTLVLIIIPSVYSLYFLMKAKTTADFATLSKWIKAIIFTGILSMIFFKIFG